MWGGLRHDTNGARRVGEGTSRMTHDRMHHLFMRAMVWNMRWMSRYAGFIARPIVRAYGENEIIACGLRNAEGDVAIIYTPRTGHRDHAVRIREGRRWVNAMFNSTTNFSGSVVRCLSIPAAQNGMRYKVVGTTAGGRRLHSPTITVKAQTIYDHNLLEIKSFTDRGVLFSWRPAEAYDPMIYFLAIEDERGENTYAAIYTRETSWVYPKIKSASYAVGPAHPPPLDLGKRYAAKLTLVDYDGWVSHIAIRTFSVS